MMAPDSGMIEQSPMRQQADKHTKLSDRQVRLVSQACALIDAMEGEAITLTDLAEQLAVSPWHLQRVFKKATGISPRDYADAKRAERFRAGLKRGDSIAGATYEAGYGSSSRVYEGARWQLGMTPASYAKGGKGAHLVYDLVETPMGLLLVAATAKGICFVSLGESEAALVATLEAEFPAAAAIVRDRQGVGPALEALLAFLQGEAPQLALSLDIRATAFQRRVWQELIAIPYGETRSYGEVADQIGLPQGHRAVARACATNPIALIVPCHRVLRGDGSIGGYRWGVQRKEALLSQEILAAE